MVLQGSWGDFLLWSCAAVSALQVERMRAENQLREGILAENLRRQQAAIARNVQR